MRALGGLAVGSRWLEGTAVIALLAGTAWLGSLVRHNYVAHGGAGQVAGRVSAPIEVPASDATGNPLPVRLSEQRQPVLVLVLSTQCPYCAENMEAWKRLVAAWRGAVPDGEVLALSIGSVAQTREYLDDHGLAVDFRTVDPAVLPLIGATGYPTTAVYVPADGSLAVWSGLLGEAEHEAVLGLVVASSVANASGGG